MASAKGKPKGLLLAIAGDDEAPPSSKGGGDESPPSSKDRPKSVAFDEAAGAAYDALVAEDKAAFKEAFMAAVYACSED